MAIIFAERRPDWGWYWILSPPLADSLPADQQPVESFIKLSSFEDMSPNEDRWITLIQMRIA